MNRTNTVILLVVVVAVAGVAGLVAFVSPDAEDRQPGPRLQTEPGQPTPLDSSGTDTEAVPSRQSMDEPPRDRSAHVAIMHKLPEIKLTSQSGEAFGTDQLFGRTWIVSFLDAASSSPLADQVAGMVELRQALQDQGFSQFYQSLNKRDLWDDIRLVSVSLQAEVAADKLLARAKQLGADGQRWRVVSGSQDKLDHLRQAIRHEDKPLDGAQMVLVDPQGHVRGYYDRASPERLEALKRDVIVVAQERLLPFPDLLQPAWMEARRKAQLETRDKFDVFHGFSFSDRLPESGIRFRNRIVDDAGRNWKPAHYDHGNGVAIADVDGDGRHDIYFVTQVGRNELWRNLGGGKFADMTEQAGVGLAERIGVTASFADIDNDGDADLYVTNVRGGNVLFENDGTGKFQDISAESGLAYDGHSSAAVFFDYNRDGLLDVFLVNVGVYTTEELATVKHDLFTGPDTATYQYYTANPDAFAAHVKPERSERSILFENQGDRRFVDVSEKVKLIDESWSGDASPWDVNRDGWPDLYVINMQGHDEYYENVEGREFVKKSRELFPATPWGTMGIKVFDFDNDGQMDVYLTDMHTDMATILEPLNEKVKIPRHLFELSLLHTDGNHVWGNAFFHRQSDGTFKEVSDQIGAENYWPWGLSVGDLNADGFEDVFIAACMNFPFRYAVNSVLLNNRGREFLDSEFILGVEPRRGGRTAIPWFELDPAEDANHPMMRKLRSRGVGESRVVAWGALGSRSSVIFDLDDDGDLDIVTNDFNSEPMVLISNLTEQAEAVHYLKVKLVGSKSNRDGLGASVSVHAGSHTFTKVYDGQSGYLSQSLRPLYFGLGDAESIEQVEIVWPSGVKQVVAGPLEVNRTMEITETDEPL